MAEHDLNPSAANHLSQEKMLLHTVRPYLDVITNSGDNDHYVSINGTYYTQLL